MKNEIFCTGFALCPSQAGKVVVERASAKEALGWQSPEWASLWTTASLVRRAK